MAARYQTNTASQMAAELMPGRHFNDIFISALQ